ncbi:MAG: exodeoxyribonuclease III [Bacteroidales bacterium]|nr:exodeoxyribonuclease III [Bacteroidales bacterium]
MKIISYNVNGIRAAIGKGFAEWLSSENPDIICLQETKATVDQVDMQAIRDLGYFDFWFSAQKKGYSGVAIFTKIKPDRVIEGIGIETYDNEGRMIRADFGEITLINSYFPSGTTGDIRQEVKEAYLADVQVFINRLKQERPNIILCGDFNICHTDIDIHNPSKQQNTSGFLPHERQWISDFLAGGFKDSFRMFNSEPHNYSWWSYRAGARSKNLGWRIDYHMVSETLAKSVKSASILSQVVHSDHCPIVIELD